MKLWSAFIKLWNGIRYNGVFRDEAKNGHVEIVQKCKKWLGYEAVDRQLPVDEQLVPIVEYLDR